MPINVYTAIDMCSSLRNMIDEFNHAVRKARVNGIQVNLTLETEGTPFAGYVVGIETFVSPLSLSIEPQ